MFKFEEKLVNTIEEELLEKMRAMIADNKVFWDSFATLRHECGHLNEALGFGFVFVSFRVGRYFVVPDGHNEKGYSVYDIEEIAQVNEDVKKLYTDVRSNGECFMYKENAGDMTQLGKEFAKILEAGPNATATLARADALSGMGWIQKRSFVFGKHIDNPQKRHVYRYAISLIPIEKMKRNDQQRRRAILRNNIEAFKLNQEFKRVAMGQCFAEDSPSNQLHAALLKHIKQPPSL